MKKFLNLQEIRGCMLNNILHGKANKIVYVLRRICLLYGAIVGQMTEVRGIGRRT
jgi:hypothetical protein